MVPWVEAAGEWKTFGLLVVPLSGAGRGDVAVGDSIPVNSCIELIQRL